MSADIINGLTVASALGTALVAGVFFAFSTFIMKALDRIPGSHGISAMQSINTVVINPWFALAFFGSAITSAIVGFHAFIEPGSNMYLLAGSLLYLVGTIFVTAAFNIPRNNALAKLDHSNENAELPWRKYVRSWTMWNHVRTAAAFLAAAMFIFHLIG